jgi:multimeric flavodoxin WrbA
MNITILNGNPQLTPFDKYLANLAHRLQAAGHTVTQLNLRDMTLRYCIGCWGCWVKTPGQCISQDASIEMDKAVIHSDFTLWAAPLEMGFPSALLKMALDKHLPLIHPYMEVAHNEAHHQKRYKRYPRVGMLVKKETDTDEADLRILTNIFARTALNFKTRLEFLETTQLSVEQIAGKILEGKNKPHLFEQAAGLTRGVRIVPPKKITVFNGSPRGRRGNTPILLGEFMQGFGREYEMHHLVRVKEVQEQVRAFAEAECVWFGFPLYTDAMPGIVKQFIEALEPLRGRADNPPIGFLVQSGFPEALHSRYVERYLEKLAARLGSPYLGTIVKGNGEAVRVMPPEATQGLFEKLHSLGSDFVRTGQLNPETLRRIAQPERFPAILGPVFQVFLHTPIGHAYFDNMLKQNGVYEQRFVRPFMEQV